MGFAGVMATLLLIFIAATGLLASRRLGDRRAARADPINLPAPRRRSPGVLIGVFVGSAALTFLVLRGVGPAPVAPEPSEPPRWLPLLVLLPVLAGGGVIALSLARQLRNPYVRAAARAARGDHDGAIAAVRAEMARHAAALAPPGAAAPTSEDPWAPPGVPAADPRRRALADGWNALAVIEGERKDWPAALGLIETAERVDPAHASIYRGNRGGVLVELGRPDEAIPLLREALAALPAAASWYRAVFLVSLAKGLVATRQADAAGPVLDHARRLGRGALVFPRSAKRHWRTRIDEVRAQIAAGPPTPTPHPARPAEPGPAG